MTKIDTRTQHRAAIALHALLLIPFELTDNVDKSRRDVIRVLQEIIHDRPIDDDFSEMCDNVTDMFKMFETLTPVIH
jgi:hypothetical protein